MKNEKTKNVEIGKGQYFSKIKNKGKIFIIMFIVLISILAIGIISNIQRLRSIFNIDIKQESDLPLFSYVVYDNQNKDNIKVLLTAYSKDGLEYIQCQNGQMIYANGKNKIAVDYSVKENETVNFYIKEQGKDRVSESVIVNDKVIEDTALSINIEGPEGFRTVTIENKIKLNDYNIMERKVGENGIWNRYNSGTSFNIIDYDTIQQSGADSEGNITVSAKLQNSSTGNTVILNKKIKAQEIVSDTTKTSDSLIKFMELKDIKTGKYTVIVNNETYNLKVYNIKGEVQINNSVSFGVPLDCGSDTEDAKNMIAVKIDGDLTIDKATLNAISNSYYGGPKGMMIYCTGTITNNGTISMTAKGAKGSGQNVYLWKNADGSTDYEYVPSSNRNGTRGTGSGGAGGTQYGGSRGYGSIGTSYAGGSGGRRCKRWKCNFWYSWGSRWKRICSLWKRGDKCSRTEVLVFQLE